MLNVYLVSGEEGLERYITHLLELAGLSVNKRGSPKLLLLLEPKKIDPKALERISSNLSPETPVLCIGTTRKVTGISHFKKISHLKRPFLTERFYEVLEEILGRSLSLNPEEQKNPFLGEDEKIERLRKAIPFLARIPNPIFLEGEPGTGKELYAHHLHAWIGGPFVKFAASALPEEMIEPLLFGFGSKVIKEIKRPKEGALSRARNGVLYLEGLEYLPISAQQKLLYFLDTGSFFPLGIHESLSPTLKLIVSINSSPGHLIKQERLLPSLYFRLAEFSAHLPSLRKRFIDLPLLVEHFLENYGVLYRQPYRSPSQELLKKFLLYPWPKNVLELEMVIKDMILFGQEKIAEEIFRRRQRLPISLRKLEEELDQRLEEILGKGPRVLQTGSSRKGRGGHRTESR